MAARDIMPWIASRGGHHEVRWGAMTAAEVFEIGEPVAIVDAGTLTEPPVDADQIILANDMDSGELGGIACFGPGAGNIDPMTGAAFATGAMIAYWPWNQETLFITENFSAAGAAAAAVPALTDKGESYQVTHNNTAPIGWSVEQTAGVPGTDLCARIVDVLDTSYNSVDSPLWDGTGVYLVFTLTTSA